jgi:intracellular sulfur oxidation DsrE/DsrF family protein
VGGIVGRREDREVAERNAALVESIVTRRVVDQSVEAAAAWDNLRDAVDGVRAGVIDGREKLEEAYAAFHLAAWGE